MTDRPPPPSPAQFRLLHRPLTREQARRDLILEGVARMPWTEADRLEAARLLALRGRSAVQTPERGPGLPPYARRRLLPLSERETAAMLDEAREQLAEQARQREPTDIVERAFAGTAPPPTSPPWMPLARPDRDGGVVMIGYDGTETRTSDWSRAIPPEAHASVAMCMGMLNP